jgi:hypothetical protein
MMQVWRRRRSSKILSLDSGMVKLSAVVPAALAVDAAREGVDDDDLPIAAQTAISRFKLVSAAARAISWASIMKLTHHFQANLI